jgi:hypothetical protein
MAFLFWVVLRKVSQVARMSASDMRDGRFPGIPDVASAFALEAAADEPLIPAMSPTLYALTIS